MRQRRRRPARDPFPPLNATGHHPIALSWQQTKNHGVRWAPKGQKLHAWCRLPEMATIAARLRAVRHRPVTCRTARLPPAKALVRDCALVVQPARKRRKGCHPIRCIFLALAKPASRVQKTRASVLASIHLEVQSWHRRRSRVPGISVHCRPAFSGFRRGWRRSRS